MTVHLHGAADHPVVQVMILIWLHDRWSFTEKVTTKD